MDVDTLATMITILVAVLGSSAVTIGTVLKQTNHLDTKFTKAFEDLGGAVQENGNRLTRLEEQVKGNSRRLTRLEEQVKENGERLSRMEGYLMAADGFTLRRAPQPDAGDRSADDPDPGQRAAG